MQNTTKEHNSVNNVGVVMDLLIPSDDVLCICTKFHKKISKGFKKKNGADMILICQKFTEAHIIKFIKNVCLLSAKLLIIFLYSYQVS